MKMRSIGLEPPARRLGRAGMSAARRAVACHVLDRSTGDICHVQHCRSQFAENVFDQLGVCSWGVESLGLLLGKWWIVAVGRHTRVITLPDPGCRTSTTFCG